MTSITEFMATEQLVKAIYLTLLHSLWQGAAIAGLAGIVMMFSEQSSSASRYNFLAGSTAFFVLCAIMTFVKFTSTPSDNILIEGSSTTLVNSSHNEVSTTPIDQLFSVLSSYSNRIVLLWFLIICLKSLQLYLGLQRVSNLKTKHTSDPGAKWTSLVNTLSEKLVIHRTVKLLESGLTSVPLTVGYLKPIILVPLGMLAAIPADQVEAILLHELAHIKRKDYFINIFQSVVEVLFFFNPAIWWLSSLIRAERENCCDDIAIANSSSKINYVRSLISFEEYRAQLPRLVVAFSGSENSLLKRTRRIIYNQNSTLNSMEKFILTSGLVVSGLLSLAFTDGAKEQISKTLKPVVSTISETFPTVEKTFAAFADTIPASSIHEISIINGGVTTFNAVHKGKAYKIVMKDDEVTDLYVNNAKIAKEKLGDYTDAIIEIVQFSEAMKVSAADEKKQTEKMMFAAIDDRNSPKIALAFRANREAKAASELDRQKAEEKEFAAFGATSEFAAFSTVSDTVPPKASKAPKAPRALPPVPEAPAAPEAAPSTPATPKPAKAPKAEVKAIKATKVMPAKEVKNEVIKLKAIKNVQPIVAPAIEVHIAPDVKPVINVAPKVAPAIEVHETPAPEKTKPAAKNGSPMGYSSKLRLGKSNVFLHEPIKRNIYKYNSTNDFAEQMNKELISEGLVKDPKKFSYKISNNELVIDGVKQSDELHSRIISKVVKSADHNIDFTYSKH